MGKLLVQDLITVARERRCYKVILSSAEHNAEFYEGLGLKRSGEAEMRMDFP